MRGALRFGLAITAGVVAAGMPGQLAAGEAPPAALNPYRENPAAVAEGRTLFIQHGCSGCHGVMGGGGMGVALIDDAWKFGSDDETLYKLIKGQIPEQTMPKVWTGLEDDQVWKMLAYIRSLYKGDASKVNW
jgi:cytochrome c(L)